MEGKEKVLLKLNHILFWWYYKRVPKFFHQWRLLKSIDLLKQNYEHQELVINSNEKVISGAIKEERKMKDKITELELKLMGVSQKTLDSFNKMFGTDLKGKSDEEINN